MHSAVYNYADFVELFFITLWLSKYIIAKSTFSLSRKVPVTFCSTPGMSRQFVTAGHPTGTVMEAVNVIQCPFKSRHGLYSFPLATFKGHPTSLLRSSRWQENVFNAAIHRGTMSKGTSQQDEQILSRKAMRSSTFSLRFITEYNIRQRKTCWETPPIHDSTSSHYTELWWVPILYHICNQTLLAS